MQHDQVTIPTPTQPEIMPFPNADFEDGVTGWTIAEGRGE